MDEVEFGVERCVALKGDFEGVAEFFEGPDVVFAGPVVGEVVGRDIGDGFGLDADDLWGG